MAQTHQSTLDLYPEDAQLKELREEKMKCVQLVKHLSQFREEYAANLKVAEEARDAAAKAVRMREAKLLYKQKVQPDQTHAVCKITIGLPYKSNDKEVRPVTFRFPMFKDGTGEHRETRELHTSHDTHQLLSRLLEKQGFVFAIKGENGGNRTAEYVFTHDDGRQHTFELTSDMTTEVTMQGRLRLPKELQQFTLIDSEERVENDSIASDSTPSAAYLGLAA